MSAEARGAGSRGDQGGLSLSLSLTRTHTYTHTHTQTHARVLAPSLFLSLAHTHTHTLTHTLSLSLQRLEVLEHEEIKAGERAQLKIFEQVITSPLFSSFFIRQVILTPPPQSSPRPRPTPYPQILEGGVGSNALVRGG